MTIHYIDALFETLIRRQFARREVMHGVTENPRVIERAASDADRSATSFFKHSFRRLRCRDVAVSDDGYARHGLNHCTDAREIHRPAESLLSCAAMHGNRGNA